MVGNEYIITYGRLSLGPFTWALYSLVIKFQNAEQKGAFVALSLPKEQKYET